MRTDGRIAELIKSAAFGQAIEELRMLEEQRSLNVTELLSKALALELLDTQESEEEARDRFRAVEAALTAALALDSDSVEALLELAHFYYAIKDDATRAKPLFERALSISRKGMAESAAGVAQCIEELSSPRAAHSYLLGLRQDLLREIDEKVAPLLEEYESSMNKAL